MKTVRQVSGIGRHGIHPREPQATQRAASDPGEIVHRFGCYVRYRLLIFVASNRQRCIVLGHRTTSRWMTLHPLINQIFGKKKREYCDDEERSLQILGIGELSRSVVSRMSV